jgi:hypothetical protein
MQVTIIQFILLLSEHEDSAEKQAMLMVVTHANLKRIT